MPDQSDASAVWLNVSTRSEVWPLCEWLQRAPGVVVMSVADEPAPTELGVGDALQVVAAAGGGGAGIVLAIRTLPEFIRSRRSDVEITVTARGRQVVLKASNVEDVMPVLDRMLDG